MLLTREGERDTKLVALIAKACRCQICVKSMSVPCRRCLAPSRSQTPTHPLRSPAPLLDLSPPRLMIILVS
jgi:hypothetical protein